MDPLAARKVIELRQKLAGIQAEFAGWMADAGEDKPLRKHQSQISHITRQLGVMVDGLRAQLDALARDDELVLGRCREVQIRVLEVHRLWDYFRSKLSLRYVEWFRDYLAVADELAHACYAPARDACTGGVVPRTIPLVFFSGEFSPYTHARDTAFAVETVENAMSSRELREFADRLPVPVIGVPWYQVSHLPDVLMIAHEVGHGVEDDFGLGEPMEAALEPILAAYDEDAEFAWNHWRRELFADLYGLLAVGPAYTMALADLLATDTRSIVAETGEFARFDVHPPATLRLAAQSVAIDKLELAVDPAESRSAWERTFAAAPGDRFHLQVKDVTETLLGVSYRVFGNRTLASVLEKRPDPVGCRAVKQAALAELRVNGDDVRVLMAGARMAFEENAESYVRPTVEDALGPQDRILARAVANIDSKTRHAGPRELSEQHDLTAGAELLRALETRDAKEQPRE
ncbi:hypothetical protein OJ997_21745 [Solirubrobacter phytolaccae]|uniref:Uncharacterized protein n=1 Tax=Solirubrobacter phytolaccae TaxID=1404360 RepID=A0A9X3NF46_9ACTN|nr:hypothetical protein [Solirubrobacter phytolaccae]MDA0182951.1 hypothetical protein [Solirubrobacter phytolaccae]